MKTEMQKCLDDEPYLCTDREILEAIHWAQSTCDRYNSIPHSEADERDAVIRDLLGSAGDNLCILSPFFCDVGFRIRIGDNFFSNYHLTMGDQGGIYIGDNVWLGPNVSLITTNHPLDPVERRRGLVENGPIHIEDNVWIGCNVTVLPGVTIGADSVVGAGSVVTRDVAPDTLVAGNPARKLKDIG